MTGRCFMSQGKIKTTIKKRKVGFVFDSPGSEKVSLVGNFNGWDENKNPMKNDGNGVWTKAVMLTPGTHEYKFFVDNKWKQDPKNDRLIPNEFGTLNNIIEVK